MRGGGGCLVDGVDVAAKVEQDARNIRVAVGTCNVEKRFLAKEEEEEEEEEEENEEEEALKSEVCHTRCCAP
jgi:hypothetical protein